MGALYIASGMSVSREDFRPWFAAMSRKSRETPPWKVAEIHLGKAKIHLHSYDRNPRDSIKKRELVEREKRLYKHGMRCAGRRFPNTSGVRGIQNRRAVLGTWMEGAFRKSLNWRMDTEILLNALRPTDQKYHPLNFTGAD